MWKTNWRVGDRIVPEREGRLSLSSVKVISRREDILNWLPGIVLGVFLARIIGEWIGLPGWWAAVALSAALAAIGGWLLARWPLRQTWPALLLLAYVIYPEPMPIVAASVAAVTTVAWLWVGLGGRAPERVLALRHKRVMPWLVAGLIFIAAFAAYTLTLAPDVLPADSGELQVIAANLGVAHPPGFPLYTMLAHAMTRLPVVQSPAYMVNLFSALTSALTLAIVFLTVFRVTGRYWPGVIAALALGSATTYWSQATTANVRSLTGLFTALVFLTAVQFRETVTADGQEHRADRRLILLAFFLGLGVGHHPSLVFLALVVLIYVLFSDRPLIRQPRRWFWPIVAGLAGLLPYLYLPLRAGSGVRGASPALASWSGFLEHALATGFRGDLFYFTEPAALWQRFLVMGNVFTFQFVPVLIAGTAIALGVLMWRDRPSAWLFGGTVLVFTIIAATYRAPQTVEYMLPAYIAAALILGCGLGCLAAVTFGERTALWDALVVLLASILLVASVLQVGRSFRNYAEVRGALRTRADVTAMLADAPPNSVILAHWHWATPLWYLQEVEGQRPDVETRFVFPEGESYDTTWERRTREAFASGRPVITTYHPERPPQGLPVAEPMGEALLYPQEPRLALPTNYIPMNMTLADSVEVLGYAVSERAGAGDLMPGEELVLTIAWRPVNELPAAASLFAHAVGRDGVIYGQDDQQIAAAEGITLTQFRITTRPTMPAGDLAVSVGVALPDQSERRELTSVKVVPDDRPPYTGNPVYHRPLNCCGRTLIGYDWDSTMQDRARLYLHWRDSSGYSTEVVDDITVSDLPVYRGPWGVPRTESFPQAGQGDHYVPLGDGIVWTGGTLPDRSLSPDKAEVVAPRFRSSRPVDRDYVVSVRLIGLEPDGYHWSWWDLQDSIPAMGAIPTLKWVTGSGVRSPHQVAVAPQATPGQSATAALTLYDAFTNRPLPILDERITAAAPWIPLGLTQISE